jgi:nucleotide-binding universal stress UspA family protein
VAVLFARACHADVRVVHVCPGLPPCGAGTAGSVIDGKAPRERIDNLHRCAERAIAFGLATGSVLLHGEPAAEIVRAAADPAADLIVMGRHGRSEPTAGIVGPVTERVIKEASCPVVVARSFPRPPDKARRHVLCALDLGPTAGTTLGYAMAVADALEGDLLVLAAADPERLPDAGKGLAALLAKAPEPSRGLQQRVVTGTAYQEILAAARESGSDLVVIGSHGGGFADRPFLGSTTVHLLRQSPCPVVVVPVGLSRRREPPSRRETRSALDTEERPDVATRLRSGQGLPDRRRPSGWWGR